MYNLHHLKTASCYKTLLITTSSQQYYSYAHVHGSRRHDDIVYM